MMSPMPRGLVRQDVIIDPEMIAKMEGMDGKVQELTKKLESLQGLFEEKLKMVESQHNEILVTLNLQKIEGGQQFGSNIHPQPLETTTEQPADPKAEPIDEP